MSLTEEFLQPRCETFLVLNFTGPDDEGRPTHLLEHPHVSFVSFHVAFEFRAPIGNPRFRHVSVVAAIVLMPEAPMNEQYPPSPCEHEVWTSGERFHVEPIAISEPIDHLPDAHLRLRVLAADAPHVLAPHLGRNPIHFDSPGVKYLFANLFRPL